MSSISELANCPELNFIDNMTLSETEEQLRTLYKRYYCEITGEEPSLSEADPIVLLMKSFSAIEYQTMQYINALGRNEFLKTSTGEALDALAALEGLTRKSAEYAKAAVRFTLSAERSSVTAIPAGTRVKTADGFYFSTCEYAEIAAGERSADITVCAETAGTGSNGIEKIDILVDPIPYIESVASVGASFGGTDTEDDDALTRRIYLAASAYSCAGSRDAYEYHARAWRNDVADVVVVSPAPDEVNVYFTIDDTDGVRLPSSSETEEMTEYLSGEDIRPLCDLVTCLAPVEKEYSIEFSYKIASSEQKSAGEIQSRVNTAVSEYKLWQRKLGRDLNPLELLSRLRAAGVKRVELVSPADTVISAVELPECVSTVIEYGGLEDD